MIAIDGPSGVGKSSVSKALATGLQWTYLDTGAMYRTVTLAWLRTGDTNCCYQDPCWLNELVLDFQGSHITLAGEDVSVPIRHVEITSHVSKVSADPNVRTFLTTMQRSIAGRRPCILDGRDIGTVVFPDAFFKVFLTASAEVRAERRWLQMGGDKASQSLDEVRQDQESRDFKDSSRATAPLCKAEDAFLVYSDQYPESDVVALLEAEARKRLAFIDPN